MNLNLLIPFFLVILFLISIFILYLLLKRKPSESIRNKIENCVVNAFTVQSLLHCLKKTFPVFFPSIVDIGVYKKTKNSFVRMDSLNNEDILTEDLLDSSHGKSKPRLPSIIYDLNFKNLGRFFIHSVLFNHTALVIMSKEHLKLDELELPLKIFLERVSTLSELEEKETILKNFSAIMSSHEVLEKLMFDEEVLSSFVVNSTKLLLNVPYVEIEKGNKSLYKIGNEKKEPCKEFHLRGTNYTLNVCGRVLSGEEKGKLGKFLDVFSFLIGGEDFIKNYMELLTEIVKDFENSTPFYKNHSLLVKEVSVLVGRRMGFSQNSLESIKYGAYLHDIGMVTPISNIAFENKVLTEREKLKLKYHPIIGASLVSPITRLYPTIKDIVLQHHEFCDGTGYPYGLKCGNIIPEAQVVALAEVFIGLISDRPYRKGKSFDEAYRIITSESSTKFLPEVIEAFSSEYKRITQTIDSIRKGK